MSIFSVMQFVYRSQCTHQLPELQLMAKRNVSQLMSYGMHIFPEPVSSLSEQVMWETAVLSYIGGLGHYLSKSLLSY